jgi:MoaA/NifB/PqqE/SkfB family radical SAM enzyme
MKRFKRVYVEITNVCNLTCSICPGTKRKPSFMSPESFEAILKKIKPFTDYLYLHVMGEPLLHPELHELLKICETLQFQVNIATNGVLIKKHQDSLINSKALRQINFSVHCLEIQRNSEIPDNYMSDILEFIGEGGKTSKAYFALRLWNLKKGDKMDAALLKQIGEFFRLPYNTELHSLGKERGSRVPRLQSAATDSHGTPLPRSSIATLFKIEDRIIREKGIQLAPNVFLNLAEEFKWPETDLISKRPGDSGFCRGLRDHCAILVDGTVVPCCLDREGVTSLGNIFKLEFDNIIDGEKAQRIIVGFSEGKAVEPLCKNCEFRKRFSK